MLNIKVGETYRNIKTGDLYKVLHLARSAWDTEQHLVIYGLNEQPELFPWARSFNEFCEKFEEVKK
jgi:hypothetical protein